MNFSFATPQGVHLEIAFDEANTPRLMSHKVNANAAEHKKRLLESAAGFAYNLDEFRVSEELMQAWRAARRFCNELAEAC